MLPPGQRDGLEVEAPPRGAGRGIRDGPLARGCREHPALHRSPGDESWQLAQRHPPHGRQNEDVEGAGTSPVERGPEWTSLNIPRPASVTTSVTVGAVRARGDEAGWEEGLVQPWDPPPPPHPPTTAPSPLLAPLPDQSQPRCPPLPSEAAVRDPWSRGGLYPYRSASHSCPENSTSRPGTGRRSGSR